MGEGTVTKPWEKEWDSGKAPVTGKPWEMEYGGGEETPPKQIRTGVFSSQEDPGPIGAGFIAFGRAGDKMLTGANRLRLQGLQKYHEARGNADEVKRIQGELDASSAEQASKDEAYAPLAESRPVSTALGGAVPYAMPMGGVVRTAGISAGMGALEAEPGERLSRAGTMGILGGGGALAGNLLHGAIAPGQRVQNQSLLTSPLSEVLDRARGFTNPDASGQILRNMERRGLQPRLSDINTTPGQNSLTRQTEDYLSRAPGSSGVMAEHAAKGQRVMNTEAAVSIGERSRNLSAETLADATQRIGHSFEQVRSLPGHPISLGPDVGQAAQEVLRQQSMRPISQNATLRQLATQLQTYSRHNGRLTGEAYNALRSDISAAANTAFREGNSAAGNGYNALLDAVDGAATASLNRAGHGELATALTTARGEYANLMSLERGRTVTAAGDVNPQALSGVMRQKYPRQYREGRMDDNPLFDIARYGETYPPLRAGSQTFERQAIQDIAEAPAAMATGAERAGPSMMGLATAPFNYAAAQYMTSPLARFLSRRGLLGQAELSTTGGVLSNIAARNLSAGMPGSMGLYDEAMRLYDEENNR
jgi:hypothetical protein